MGQTYVYIYKDIFRYMYIFIWYNNIFSTSIKVHADLCIYSNIFCERISNIINFLTYIDVLLWLWYWTLNYKSSYGTIVTLIQLICGNSFLPSVLAFSYIHFEYIGFFWFTDNYIMYLFCRFYILLICFHHINRLLIDMYIFMLCLCIVTIFFQVMILVDPCVVDSDNVPLYSVCVCVF